MMATFSWVDHHGNLHYMTNLLWEKLTTPIASCPMEVLVIMMVSPFLEDPMELGAHILKRIAFFLNSYLYKGWYLVPV